MKKKNAIMRKAVTLMLAAAMICTALPVLNAPAFTAEAASLTASGKINDDDVNLRKSATTDSASIGVLNKGAKLTIHQEVFTGTTSNAATKRWYKVTAGSKTGYVRADLVDISKYGSKSAVSTDVLNYRKGPATTFKVLGTMGMGAQMKLQLPAKRSGSKESWYRVKVNGNTGYVISDYVKLGKSLFITKTKKQLEGKSDLAKALLRNPQGGGEARIVYTFDTSNCKKLFSIEGYKNAKVPQGLAFTGSEYYVLYGMAAGQAIVTYSTKGKRLSSSKFSFCIGHPNGITWDPATKRCYIFKGNTKRIYTWNPVNKKFGKSKTPYSSSGVGYDKTTDLIYASSRTGIRAYSSDGSFTHKKLFTRCSHGIFHYTQDCGAGGGFIFHGISGANKKTTNYLDVYRAADNAYLGSIKIKLGEIESAVVGNDGYVRLLINTMGNDTDYIWKTPLNVNELK
ncbi:MAG: SH3 domain-containing protein [Mogibacterium sp.]|nr:SH3 domain-containing protein [Mogibacterium sp.]